MRGKEEWRPVHHASHFAITGKGRGKKKGKENAKGSKLRKKKRKPFGLKGKL
jgi:hypothetical protein